MSQPLRIAVADDEADTRDYLKELLPRLGHEVVAVGSGRELVELCRATKPDLVITDIRMPDMDGLQAAAEINRDGQMPVILVTAYHDADVLAPGAADYVMAYLAKPVAKDGPLAGASAEADLFRDRVDDEEPLRLRLLVLHDDDGAEDVRARVSVTEQIAQERGVSASVIRSEGSSPVERLASLVGLVDYATVYLALLSGQDPTPVAPIDALKSSLRPLLLKKNACVITVFAVVSKS